MTTSNDEETTRLVKETMKTFRAYQDDYTFDGITMDVIHDHFKRRMYRVDKDRTFDDIFHHANKTMDFVHTAIRRFINETKATGGAILRTNPSIKRYMIAGGSIYNKFTYYGSMVNKNTDLDLFITDFNKAMQIHEFVEVLREYKDNALVEVSYDEPKMGSNGYPMNISVVTLEQKTTNFKAQLIFVHHDVGSYGEKLIEEFDFYHCQNGIYMHTDQGKMTSTRPVVVSNPLAYYCAVTGVLLPSVPVKDLDFKRLQQFKDRDYFMLKKPELYRSMEEMKEFERLYHSA